MNNIKQQIIQLTLCLFFLFSSNVVKAGFMYDLSVEGLSNIEFSGSGSIELQTLNGMNGTQVNDFLFNGLFDNDPSQPFTFNLVNQIDRISWSIDPSSMALTLNLVTFKINDYCLLLQNNSTGGVCTGVFGHFNKYSRVTKQIIGSTSTRLGTLSAAFVPKQDIPEPSTLTIFALGMIGLVSHRFKK